MDRIDAYNYVFTKLVKDDKEAFVVHIMNACFVLYEIARNVISTLKFQ